MNNSTIMTKEAITMPNSIVKLNKEHTRIIIPKKRDRNFQIILLVQGNNKASSPKDRSSKIPKVSKGSLISASTLNLSPILIIRSVLEVLFPNQTKTEILRLMKNPRKGQHIS